MIHVDHAPNVQLVTEPIKPKPTKVKVVFIPGYGSVVYSIE